MSGEMITKTGLRERGWTVKLIQKFAPTADKTRRNPHAGSWVNSPIQLYSLTRIVEIEQDPEFVKEREKAEKRRNAAKKSAQERREQTLAWAESLPEPELPDLSPDELVSRACEHYNDLWRWRGEPDKVAMSSDSDEFLNRIAVNYLRHELTQYESSLYETRRKIGAREARELIRRKILDAIADKYLWLSSECSRQDERFRRPRM